VSDTSQTISRDALLQTLYTSWNELTAYLNALTADQMTGPTDAAGWTAKDHLIHLAIWEQGALALLNRQSKREAMQIPADVWEQDDDPINAVIQQRYHDMPLARVWKVASQTHEQFVAKLESMTEDELLLPYRYYRPEEPDERPLMLWLPFDSFYHYRDHLTWIKAIVENGSSK
jgi:hypothetical protein